MISANIKLKGQRLLVVVLNLLALAVLCWIAAYWIWRWFAPALVLSAISLPSSELSIPPGSLFGAVNRSSPSTTAATSTAASDYRLLGVFSESGGQGYALFQLAERKSKLVKQGQEIKSGVILRKVESDAIQVEEKSDLRRIALRENSKSLLTARPTSQICPLAAGELQQAYLLRSELLEGLTGNKEIWAALLQPAADALIVKDEGSVGKLLGLQAADRLERSNGVQLANLEDVSRYIIQPLQQHQVVRISGTRQTKKREWIFLDAALCGYELNQVRGAKP